MNSLQEALIKQQLEFTLSQLEEYKQKEENLKKTNDSLLRALSENNSNPLNTHTVIELQKRLEIQEKENNDLKLKISEVKKKFEQEKQELNLAVRESELLMKQQKISFEGEKLQLLGTIQKLEGENFTLSNLSKYSQKPSSDLQKFQLQDLSKSFAKEKEELQNDSKRIREDYEKSIHELKSLYENENQNLRKTVSELQSKLKSSLLLIDELKDKGSELIDSRTDELECQIEYYKELYLNANKTLSNKGSLAETVERQKFLNEIENLTLQNSKISLELEKAQLEVKKQKMELLRFQDKYCENERNLKNEIKILIGKLMKAKSKLGSENEFRETMRRENLTNRSNSSNRSRNNLSYY